MDKESFGQYLEYVMSLSHSERKAYDIGVFGPNAHAGCQRECCGGGVIVTSDRKRRKVERERSKFTMEDFAERYARRATSRR